MQGSAELHKVLCKSVSTCQTCCLGGSELDRLVSDGAGGEGRGKVSTKYSFSAMEKASYTTHKCC